MATVSPKLTIPFTVGTSQIVGQGNLPEAWILYSTDGADDTDPLWVDATAKVKSFDTDRGRPTELEQVDAGTASITLDNRTRTFDPIHNTAIRPLNRWWVREQFSGETQDIFKGYAESYRQLWPDTTEPQTVVSCYDEFGRLARSRLPVPSPPRDTYADVVLSDSPTCFWQFPAGHPLDATVGPALTVGASMSSAGSVAGGGAIVGEEVAGWVTLASGTSLHPPPFGTDNGEPGNASGLAEFTIETWFMTGDATPAGQRSMIFGLRTIGGDTHNWTLRLNTDGSVQFQVDNTTPTAHTVNSNVALTDNAWHHVVGTIDAGSVRVYVNGTQAGSTAWTGTVQGDGVALEIDGATESFSYDEVAFYPTGMSAARVAAHYQAGAQRGFPAAQISGARAAAILNAVSSQAPRRIDVGERQMPGRFMRGQTTLEELRTCEKAEKPDGVLFISRAGEIVLLDNDHRVSSPYNTVQATFDDDGSDLPYELLEPDYSEAFIVNEWNLTGTGDAATGLGAFALDTSIDTASQTQYGQLPRSDSFPVIIAADLTAIGDDLLAKYKDPLQRIKQITLTTHVADVAEAAFRRDIGDRIRVFRRPPGGGTAYDQTLFIQSIRVSGVAGDAWQIVWGVSPV